MEQVLADLALPIEGERPSGNASRRAERRKPFHDRRPPAHHPRRPSGRTAPRPDRLESGGRAHGFDPVVDVIDHDDEPNVWQPEDTARFLEHVLDDRLSALYELAAYAGPRRAELCGVRWSDTDANGAGLRVPQTIVSVTRNQVTPEQATCPVCDEIHVGRLFKAPKSRKGRRWVPLAAPAQEALARHRVVQQEEHEFFGIDYQDHGLVFCRSDGIPLRPDLVTVEVERHVAACGLRPCPCRHQARPPAA